MSFCADNEKRDGEEQQLKIAQCMQLLMLLVYLPQVVLVPLVANIPQALPIEVLQVSQTQAASESR